jgi:hypothetical protein
MPDLTHAGWSASKIENVIGGNWLRVFKDVWGAEKHEPATAHRSERAHRHLAHQREPQAFPQNLWIKWAAIRHGPHPA